jgi:fructosamine-3-kinase
MDRLPGKPITWTDETVMAELGTRLREVHDRILARPNRFGYLGEHHPMESQSTWQEAFRDMWHRLLDDIRNCGGYDSEEDRYYRALLDRFIERFDHFHRTAPLLHMDVWAENILTNGDGRLTGLIDWDRACWGDPEIEYAVLDYCGISTPGFWQGYSPNGHDPRADDPDADIRQVFYLLYEVQKYIVIRIARNADPQGAERYRHMARDLAAQLT